MLADVEEVLELNPGDCLCHYCGVGVSDQVGTLGYNLSCPQYGTKMLRR